MIHPRLRSAARLRLTLTFIFWGAAGGLAYAVIAGIIHPSGLALATGAIVSALISIRYELRGIRRALEDRPPHPPEGLLL